MALAVGVRLTVFNNDFWIHRLAFHEVFKMPRQNFSYSKLYLVGTFSGLMLIPFAFSGSVNHLSLLFIWIFCFAIIFINSTRALFLKRPHRSFFIIFYILAPIVGVISKTFSVGLNAILSLGVVVAYVAYVAINAKSITRIIGNKL